MQKRKVYSTDTINRLNVEINQFREVKVKELTLDKILLQAKKGVADLIDLKCTANEIAAIFNRAGIKVGVNKIKQLYFKSVIRRVPKQSNKVN